MAAARARGVPPLLRNLALLVLVAAWRRRLARLYEDRAEAAPIRRVVHILQLVRQGHGKAGRVAQRMARASALDQRTPRNSVSCGGRRAPITKSAVRAPARQGADPSAWPAPGAVSAGLSAPTIRARRGSARASSRAVRYPSGPALAGPRHPFRPDPRHPPPSSGVTASDSARPGRAAAPSVRRTAWRGRIPARPAGPISAPAAS